MSHVPPHSFGNKQCIQKTYVRTLASLFQRQSHWVESNSPSELLKMPLFLNLLHLTPTTWVRRFIYDKSAHLTVKELSILRASSLAKSKYKSKGQNIYASSCSVFHYTWKYLGSGVHFNFQPTCLRSMDWVDHFLISLHSKVLSLFLLSSL